MHRSLPLLPAAHLAHVCMCIMPSCHPPGAPFPHPPAAGVHTALRALPPLRTHKPKSVPRPSPPAPPPGSSSTTTLLPILPHPFLDHALPPTPFSFPAPLRLPPLFLPPFPRGPRAPAQPSPYALPSPPLPASPPPGLCPTCSLTSWTSGPTSSRPPRRPLARPRRACGRPRTAPWTTRRCRQRCRTCRRACRTSGAWQRP